MIRDLVWFKSTYSSGAEADSCVEIATTPSAVHVRDSKVVDGPVFQVAASAWAEFVTYASGGEHRGQ
ncbi:DUF397 domain-containing protein [Streptomyces sp. NBC_00199]|uniref:DUF397 domain-containing protein n=1 Tax=Streptomyces sp. NBC_00199 TaxID=2975678 RepID=UPI00224F7BEB|nr:DUF397 domain-containing protein [Streptomyces sp. NBC_00199]MCX5268526.1 DUF397 domain-containing protein [Streptomyces sp. NBC_00199]